MFGSSCFDDSRIMFDCPTKLSLGLRETDRKEVRSCTVAVNEKDLTRSFKPGIDDRPSFVRSKSGSCIALLLSVRARLIVLCERCFR